MSNNMRKEILEDMKNKGISEAEEIEKIVETICSAENWEKYHKYISEVLERCAQLVKINEYERAKNEYKFMIYNIRKEAGL